VVEVTGERAGVNMISVVSPRGTLHLTVFSGRCNATVFVEFLTKLTHDAPGPVYLILDNLSVHKAKIVKDYVDSLEGRLKLFFLPSYSPELNPDEWVWKNVKNDQVGRTGIERKSELYGVVTRALERLQRLPETVRGFFRDPSLAYIRT
jgi:transposase